MSDNMVLVLSLVIPIFTVLVIAITAVIVLVLKEDIQDVKRDMKSG